MAGPSFYEFAQYVFTKKEQKAQCKVGQTLQHTVQLDCENAKLWTNCNFTEYVMC